jgi:hypothetical protein
MNAPLRHLRKRALSGTVEPLSRITRARPETDDECAKSAQQIIDALAARWTAWRLESE